MSLGENPRQNPNKNRIDKVEDLVRFGPVVLVNLLLEGVRFVSGLEGQVLGERVLRDGGEGFHRCEL